MLAAVMRSIDTTGIAKQYDGAYGLGFIFGIA
jgi:hypothetical protein